MPVIDLQAWADYTNGVRLPLIESDVYDLQRDLAANTTLLNHKIQHFQDTLDAHSVRIDIAQDTADTAQANAIEALQGLTYYFGDAKIYADQLYAQLQDQITGLGTSITDYIDTDLTSYINLKLTQNLPQLQALLDAKLAEAEVIRNELDTQLTEFEEAATDILDDVLPKLETIQNQVEFDVNEVKNRFDTLMTDYAFLAIQEGFDEIKAKNESDIAPMGGSVLRPPSSQWTSDITTAYPTLVKPGLGLYGTFYSDDADFGECFEFEVGDTKDVGPSFPSSFDPTRVYKLSLTWKTVDDGVSALGATTKFVVTTQTGPTIVENNKTQDTDPGTVLVADGVQSCSIYVGTDATVLDEYGVPTSQRILLTGSADANKIYFGIRQNAGGTSDGQIRVGSLYLTDVTEALNSYKQLKTELNAELDTVKADLETNYYTITGADTAIAAATLDLKTEMESASGSVGSLSASLTNNYYTVTQTDAAISALETDLRAEFGSFTNGYSESNFIDGIGDFDDANSSVVASTSPNLPIGVIRALELEAQKVFDGALKSGPSMGGRIFRATGWALAENSTTDVVAGIHTVQSDGTTNEYTEEVIAVGGTTGWVQFSVDIELPADVIQWRPYFGFSTTPTANGFVAEIFLRDVSGSEQNSAAIAAEAIARASADDALAGQITSLTATVGAVESSLETDYYTIAETDSAISLAQTTLQSNIDGVSADLTTNYYTKTEVDNQTDSAWEAASAAQTAKLAAETAEANAETAALNAATSETNAENASSTAGISATAAADAENASQGHADAAASHALAASTSADEAEVKAQAAQSAEITATASAVASSKNLALQGVSVLTTPAEAWTGQSTSAENTLKKPAPTDGTFVTDDTDFGDAYDFAAGASRTIGPAYPLPWDDSIVYEVKARFRVVDEGLVSAGYRIGGTVQIGTALAEANKQSPIVDGVGIGDGIQEVSVWFTRRDSGSMPELPDDVELVTFSSAADGGTKFYPHFRQNPTTQDGQFRLATLEVRDVTSVVDAMIAEEEAGGAATAAVTASQAAEASATEAGQHAFAADTSKVEAETARSNAESFALSAADSETGAALSAAQAATSAGLSADSENAAGAAATAAANSASSAETFATDAEVSAQAAETKRLEAATSADEAADNAAAALTHVSVAQAHKDAAETFANAAETSRLQASSAAGNASIQAASAATSASDAENAASDAFFARDVASRALAGGEHPNPIFVEPDDNPTAMPTGFYISEDYGTSVTRQALGGKYGAYLQCDNGTSLTENHPRVYSNSSDHDNQAAQYVEAVEIDIEFERISGSLGSACVIVGWIAGNGGSSRNVRMYLSDAIPNAQGTVRKLSFMAERPDGYVPGDRDEIQVNYYGHRTDSTKSDQHNVIRIHRFDYRYVATSASALIAQRAVTDLQGNAAASFVMRAKAGAASGSVEIVAADQVNSGAKSKVTLTGDEIAFDGMSVFEDDLKSTTYVPNSLGWRIRKNGYAEFQNLTIGRDLVKREGTLEIPTFTPGSSGQGEGPSNGLWVDGSWAYLGKTIWVRYTPESLDAWAGARSTYLCLVEQYSGGVSRLGSAGDDTYWGWKADVMPLTRWTGNQTLRLRIQFWHRHVTQVNNPKIRWKLYEVT